MHLAARSQRLSYALHRGHCGCPNSALGAKKPAVSFSISICKRRLSRIGVSFPPREQDACRVLEQNGNPQPTRSFNRSISRPCPFLLPSRRRKAVLTRWTRCSSPPLRQSHLFLKTAPYDHASPLDRCDHRCGIADWSSDTAPCSQARFTQQTDLRNNQPCAGA